MSGGAEEAKTVEVTVKTDEGFVKKKIDPLQIAYLKDTYYETRIFMENGDVWVTKELLKELSEKIKKWQSE